MINFALVVAGRVTSLVTVRLKPFQLGKRKAELSLLKLDFANSENQVLTVLCSGKETQITWTYGKKVVDNANKGTATTEEPTKLLTVFMLLAMLKRAIT